MKIYTKKGDQGQTYLFGGGPFPKDDARVIAYGNVDELNSLLGCCIAELGAKHDLLNTLVAVQKELFVLGAELATVDPKPELAKGFLQMEAVQRLEREIDEWESELAPLKQFILPGGCKASAFLHLARTVCRRAERSIVGVSRSQTLRPEPVVYLNRLSDWLFVIARIANRRTNIPDVLWEGILK